MTAAAVTSFTIAPSAVSSTTASAPFRTSGEADRIELAYAAIRGDRQAFGELIERYERVALATAYGCCRDGAKASDAVQEACLLAWRKRETLADPAKFGGWLLGIVKRCAIDQIRRGGMRVPPPEVLPISTPAPDEDAEARERGDQVRKALDELDEPTRIAVAMRYYDDCPSREIADALGCTPAAVDMRLKRARDLLRTRLAKWFGND